MKKTLCVLLLTFAVVTPALADDAKTIAQRLDDKWIEAFNKKDAAALTALYTADAVLLPQGKDQPIIGANNIRKFMDEMIGEKLENMVLPVAEANMLDQKSLYQAGTWAADAGGQHVTGTYLSVIVQEGADWKYRADTWNMMPPPPAASATTGSSSANK
ncbi:DUF4440 domain-containing protein [Bradyrhizobium sp. 18BD]